MWASWGCLWTRSRAYEIWGPWSPMASGECRNAQQSFRLKGRKYAWLFARPQLDRCWLTILCQVSTGNLAMFPSHELQVQWKKSTWWDSAAQLSGNVVMDVRSRKKRDKSWRIRAWFQTWRYYKDLEQLTNRALGNGQTQNSFCR